MEAAVGRPQQRPRVVQPLHALLAALAQLDGLLRERHDGRLEPVDALIIFLGLVLLLQVVYVFSQVGRPQPIPGQVVLERLLLRPLVQGQDLVDRDRPPLPILPADLNGPLAVLGALSPLLLLELDILLIRLVYNMEE